MSRMTAALITATMLSLPAMANALTVAGSYSVSVNQTDPGLVIEYSELAPNPFSFDLDVGGIHTLSLFKIWTNEEWVHSGEDDIAKLASVDFSFTLPDIFGGTVNGETVGISFLGLAQWGQITWNNDPVDLSFGPNNDGLLRIWLTDEIFNKGAFGLGEGQKHGAIVKAKFKLIQDASPVPEPATLGLMGLGLLGVMAGLRRASR